MSGVMFPRTPYGATWSVPKYMEDVRGMGEYAWAEAVQRVLVDAVEKMQRKCGSTSPLHGLQNITALASWDSVDHGVRYDAFELVAGIKESKGVLTFEERLEWACVELCAEQGKHITRVKELEARLNMCQAHSEHQDVGINLELISSKSGMDNLLWTGNDLGKATEHDNSKCKGVEEDAMLTTIEHISGDSCEGQNMATRPIDIAAPPELCVDIGLPPCSEQEVVPSPLEDAGHTPSDAMVMTSREGKQHPDLVLREFGALLETHEGGEGANPNSGVRCVDVTAIAGHTPGMEGVSMGPTSYSRWDRRLGNDVTIKPGMQSVEHGLTMALESTDVEGAVVDEACVEPPLSMVVESVSNTEADPQRTPESEMTISPDIEDVPCEGDVLEKSSNLVTHMKRRPQCRKPAAAHGTPYANPTRLLGEWKR
ncbi:LOW QUALITY PROTEIN: hypothetical protein Cgig2_022632 [Carnegiea gigantea]|uniref:Uncharacterized protein n=1 Tax=Carnegiea gigantea TaxID=171969 RepID=A0A9Q1JNV1_9CARY|nr:LOW QUALITY PROTEIN: hypothetical protein Cgig2_022632 [Carnegiea gigantea]